MIKYNIVFASDENYLQHLSVGLVSLLYNNSSLEFNIYIINGGIGVASWEKLKDICKDYNANIIDLCIDDGIFSNLILNHHFTKANYYRLLIPNLIEVDKVLYLDSDLVVHGSIKELYNTNLGDFYLGAVENTGFDRHSQLKMDITSKYFNSGVMLINNFKWRESNLFSNVINFIKENKESIEFVDQCCLNGFINGNWKELPLKYNQQTMIFDKLFPEKFSYFSISEIIEAKNIPIIIHYTGSSKPWQFRNKHPYKNKYWKYLKKSPFKNVFMIFFERFIRLINNIF